MDEAEYCDRVSIIVDGRIDALDTLSTKAKYETSDMDDVQKTYEKPREIKNDTTMKQFIAFVKKEFYHISRDRRTMLILLGMPIVQMLIFGFAINMEVQNIRIAIYEPQPDAYTQDIKARVEANSYFILKDAPHSILEVNELLRKGEIDMALIFPNNFEDNIVHAGTSQVQVITDNSDPNIGSISTNYIRAIIGEQQKEWMGLQQIPYNISVTNKLHYNPEMRSAYTFVQYHGLGVDDYLCHNDLHINRKGKRWERWKCFWLRHSTLPPYFSPKLSPILHSLLSI